MFSHFTNVNVTHHVVELVEWRTAESEVSGSSPRARLQLLEQKQHCGVLATTQFAYRKGLGTCDALLCVSHTLQSALESGQEARIQPPSRSSALLLIGSTIRKFSIGSALWVLEVLCCLYWRSSHLIDHSTFWWMDVAVNWSTLCQECRRAVF